jgi:hypothetical protein
VDVSFMRRSGYPEQDHPVRFFTVLAVIAIVMFVAAAYAGCYMRRLDRGATFGRMPTLQIPGIDEALLRRFRIQALSEGMTLKTWVKLVLENRLREPDAVKLQAETDVALRASTGLTDRVEPGTRLREGGTGQELPTGTRAPVPPEMKKTKVKETKRVQAKFKERPTTHQDRPIPLSEQLRQMREDR